MAATPLDQSLQEPCVVQLTTDSQYVKQGITQWIQNWKRRGWLTASKDPVKNVESVETFGSREAQRQGDWQLGRVPGHDENERCDILLAMRP